METADSHPSPEAVILEEVSADVIFEAAEDHERIAQSTPMQIPESPAPTAEPPTPAPELSTPAPEPSAPVSEPVASTPEPTASTPESAAPTEKPSTDPAFVKLPEWTELKKPPSTEGGAIPKKVSASTEKKQKSKGKPKERTPFEHIMQQTTPRVPFSLGYIDTQCYEPLVMPLHNTNDAEFYIQQQQDLYLSALEHIHASDILVQELCALTVDKDLGEEFAVLRAKHLLVFITAVDELHQ